VLHLPERSEVLMEDPFFVAVIGASGRKTLEDLEQIESFLSTLPENAVVVIPDWGTAPNMAIRDWCVSNEKPYHTCFATAGYVEADVINGDHVAELVLRLCDEMFCFDDNDPDGRYTRLKDRAEEWDKVTNTFTLEDEASY